MPNTWRILLSLECMAFKMGVDYGVEDLLHSYYLKEHAVDKGRYLFYVRQKREPLVLGLPTNDRGEWQRFYFYAMGDGVYGSNRSERIPEYWSLTSKCFPVFVD